MYVSERMFAEMLPNSYWQMARNHLNFHKVTNVTHKKKIQATNKKKKTKKTNTILSVFWFIFQNQQNKINRQDESYKLQKKNMLWHII